MTTKTTPGSALPEATTTGSVRTAGYWAIAGLGVGGIGAALIPTAADSWDGLGQVLLGFGLIGVGIVMIFTAGLVATLVARRRREPIRYWALGAVSIGGPLIASIVLSFM